MTTWAVSTVHAALTTVGSVRLTPTFFKQHRVYIVVLALMLGAIIKLVIYFSKRITSEIHMHHMLYLV